MQRIFGRKRAARHGQHSSLPKNMLRAGAVKSGAGGKQAALSAYARIERKRLPKLLKIKMPQCCAVFLLGTVRAGQRTPGREWPSIK
jgi:hypothetical protein